jgi:hypothetical protein
VAQPFSLSSFLLSKLPFGALGSDSAGGSRRNNSEASILAFKEAAAVVQRINARLVSDSQGAGSTSTAAATSLAEHMRKTLVLLVLQESNTEGEGPRRQRELRLLASASGLSLVPEEHAAVTTTHTHRDSNSDPDSNSNVPVKPNATLTCSPKTFVRLGSGELGAEMAYMRGLIKVPIVCFLCVSVASISICSFYL